MKIIEAGEGMSATEIENEYVSEAMAGKSDVAIEITEAQAKEMDLEDDEE